MIASVEHLIQDTYIKTQSVWFGPYRNRYSHANCPPISSGDDRDRQQDEDEDSSTKDVPEKIKRRRALEEDE